MFATQNLALWWALARELAESRKTLAEKEETLRSAAAVGTENTPPNAPDGPVGFGTPHLEA